MKRQRTLATLAAISLGLTLSAFAPHPATGASTDAHAADPTLAALDSAGIGSLRKEAEKAGDATHQEARDAMKGRWRHPKKSMGWYKDVQRTFEGPPEVTGPPLELDLETGFGHIDVRRG